MTDNPIRQIHVISQGGLSVYYQTFVKGVFSEFLFSSLTGAIVSFTKELGDELILIKMKEQEFFFHNVSEKGMIVLVLAPGFDKLNIQNALADLLENEYLQLLFDSANSFGIIQSVINEEFDSFVRNLFEDLNTDDSVYHKVVELG